MIREKLVIDEKGSDSDYVYDLYYIEEGQVDLNAASVGMHSNDENNWRNDENNWTITPKMSQIRVSILAPYENKYFYSVECLQI